MYKTLKFRQHLNVKIFSIGGYMQVTAHKELNSLVVEIVGELDEHWSSTARTKLDEIISSTNCDRMTLDLKDLSFMDSTGIGVLIGRYKKLKARNINLYVKNVSSSIDKIFKMAGLYTIMPRSDKA